MTKVKSKWLFVKGIAPTKIRSRHHKRATNLTGAKNYFVIGSSLSRVRFIRKLEGQSESADPISRLGELGELFGRRRSFEVRGRMRAIYNLYIVF